MDYIWKEVNSYCRWIVQRDVCVHKMRKYMMRKTLIEGSAVARRQMNEQMGIASLDGRIDSFPINTTASIYTNSSMVLRACGTINSLETRWSKSSNINTRTDHFLAKFTDTVQNDNIHSFLRYNQLNESKNNANSHHWTILPNFHTRHKYSQLRCPIIAQL